MCASTEQLIFVVIVLPAVACALVAGVSFLLVRFIVKSGRRGWGREGAGKILFKESGLR